MNIDKILYKKEEKFYLLILGIVSICTFFSNLWTKGADLMESRNFITSREIVESSNWMITTLNGEYRFEKPPLPSWFTAIIMEITGNLNDEWVLRIPVALTALITVFYIYRFIKKLTGNIKLAFFSSFIFSTSFLIIKTAGENSWDFYPYAFIFIGISYLLEGFLDKKLISYGIGGIFLGASLLSKGPVGVYGMLIPFLIAYGTIYGFEIFKKNWKGIAVFIFVGVLITAFWPIYMLIENQELFISVLKKESQTWSNSHTRPFYYYLNFLYLNGVWSFFTVAWILKFWSNKRTLDKKSFNFIYVWHIVAFILLSVIKMKKERYGLPLYFTSSIGVAYILSYYSERGWNLIKKSDRFLLILQGGLLSLVSITIPILFFIKGYLKNILGLNYLIFITILFIAFFILLLKEFLEGKTLYMKRIAFFSGILMVLISLTTIWFIELKMRSKFENEGRYLKHFKVESDWESLPVYAKDFAIWDVWNIGKQIKKIEVTNLPEKFIYFSPEDTSLEKNLPEFLSGYKIVDKKTYFRAIDDKKNVILYKMEKGE